MRWTDRDPDFNVYWNTNLPGKVDRKITSKKGQEIFNIDFEHGMMTDWELNYLNDLITEYKEVSTSNYRRYEIWRALNYAPTDEQLAFVLPSKKDLQKYAKYFVITPVPFKKILDNQKSKFEFLGFWSQPYSETVLLPDIAINFERDFDSLTKINHTKPNKFAIPTPAFVLDRISSNWDGIFIGGSYGLNVGTSREDKNKIQNPFKTDSNGNIISIGNLDGIIRAKKYGWKYKQKDIPDQEIVHYIRRKYGFGHTINHSEAYPGMPHSHYYIIPFYDDEPEKPLNVGKIFHRESIISNLPEDRPKHPMVSRDSTISRQLSTIKESSGFGQWDYYKRDVGMTNGIIGKLVELHGNKMNNFEISWNQIFHFSTVRAYWRAAKIINEIAKYSKHIYRGLQDGSVLQVGAEIQGVNALVFISGKSDGYSKETQAEYKENKLAKKSHILYEERPWNHIFKYSYGGENSYAADRNIRLINSCTSQTQYMRHLILPDISIYLSELLYDETQIKYTKKAIDRRSFFHHPIIDEIMGTSGGLNKIQRDIINSTIGKSPSPDQFKTVTKYFKKKKPLAFFTILGFVVTLETIGTVWHGLHHFLEHYHLPFFLETGLNAYKITLNVKSGNIGFAIRDSIIYMVSTWLSYGAKVRGTYRLPTSSGGTSYVGAMIGALISFSAFLYDRWYYSSYTKKDINEFVKLVNDATKNNFLEGPYAETKGAVKISKGPNGQLPIGYNISEDGKTITNEYENFQVTSEKIDKDVYIFPSGSTISDIGVSDSNKRFLEKDGYGEKQFFSQLTKKECQTLLDIAGQLNPSNGRYNEILNLAPNHYDIGAFIQNTESGIIFVGLDPYFTSVVDDKSNLIVDIKSRIGGITKTAVGNERFVENPPKLSRVKFKYTRANITKTTDLTPYLDGKAKTSEYDFEIFRSNLSLDRVIKVDIKTVTDKEKVWLIRKKYGLDQVIPNGDCCSMFDVPVGPTFPSNTRCQYIIDFTSPEFIQKLKYFCSKKESRDKQSENKNKYEEDQNISTLHTRKEEQRVRRNIIENYNETKDKRRSNKRVSASKSNYEGSSITSQNLAQLPRLGISPGISSNSITTKNIPSDTQTSQLFAIEQIDTEKTSMNSTVNMIIDIFGTLLNISLSNRERSIDSTIEPSSTPIGREQDVPEFIRRQRTWRRRITTPPQRGTTPGGG